MGNLIETKKQSERTLLVCFSVKGDYVEIVAVDQCIIDKVFNYRYHPCPNRDGNTMAELTTILTQDDLKKIIASLAQRISSDYDGRELLCIGVLKGAFIFMADLVRKLTVPVKMDFLKASSYGTGTVSSGRPRVTGDIDMAVDGKDLLLVEDIVDTGITVKRIVDHLKTLRPKSVKICALIDKQERRDIQVSIDYAGYVANGGFLVGFGLDYAEMYRNLPGIFQLNS